MILCALIFSFLSTSIQAQENQDTVSAQEPQEQKSKKVRRRGSVPDIEGTKAKNQFDQEVSTKSFYRQNGVQLEVDPD